jgi:hypothetical protein
LPKKKTDILYYLFSFLFSLVPYIEITYKEE